MVVVNADVILENECSQHVLEKVGFDFLGEEGIFDTIIVSGTILLNE